MSWIAVGTVAASAIGGVIQGNAAKDAASTSAGAAQSGINEQQRQFDEIQKLLAPYISAGEGALGQQMALLGLSGDEAQQQAIQGIEESPQFGALTKQGEEAILQNASATGGVRGGNTPGALAQFRPALLNQLISEKFTRLGGIAGQGQASAVGQAGFGQTSATNVSNLLQQQGAAQAGGALAGGAPFTGAMQGLGFAANSGLGFFGQQQPGQIAPNTSNLQQTASAF